MNNKFKKIVFDVDGVFTTGQFLYTEEGKFAKIFGPHDNDGIKLIKQYLEVEAISADKRGWKITKKRIQEDMNIPLTEVSEKDRVDYFKKMGDLSQIIYMGDGIHDVPIFNLVGYSIAPANAVQSAIKAANYVTTVKSGEGAVLEACLHVIDLISK
ncbi:MAG: HAD hydrolase family protein [Candidatus Gracilibacteria bacterium]|jgi:3-deoxy-D-manno-octulosonate 8-phosphate phosphatase (KDO 8-P phosphatase)